MATKKDAAADAAKKAAETAVKKTRVSKEELLAGARKNALPYRIFAVILWIIAIGFEVMAIVFFTHKLEFDFTVENPGWTISWLVCLGLDLICVVIGSLLWKKGNHLDPASKKNKAGFWLRNNFGVIMTAIAFIPFIIFALTDKKAGKQSKIIAVAAAAVALIIGTLFGIDWNPVSQEELLASAHVGTVYWTDNGTVYHAYNDCYHLRNTPAASLHEGSAEESGKPRLCKTCEARAEKEEDDLSIVTDSDKDTTTAEELTPAA